jgi:hypothetical protein
VVIVGSSGHLAIAEDGLGIRCDRALFLNDPSPPHTATVGGFVLSATVEDSALEASALNDDEAGGQLLEELPVAAQLDEVVAKLDVQAVDDTTALKLAPASNGECEPVIDTGADPV